MIGKLKEALKNVKWKSSRAAVSFVCLLLMGVLLYVSLSQTKIGPAGPAGEKAKATGAAGQGEEPQPEEPDAGESFSGGASGPEGAEGISSPEASGKSGESASSGASDGGETPEPVLTSSATLGVTGDILIHMAVLEAFRTGNGFDFSSAFADAAPYYSLPDIMAANLEVPLVDPADGVPYSSNPFGSPDSIAAALKNAGVDLCTTANNHCFDKWDYGLLRTQYVLDGLGLGYAGTRKSGEDSFLYVRDVNGIRLGITCYTYETGASEYAEKTLNGIPVPEAYADLIHSFDYENLEAFYADAGEELSRMEAQGCEVRILFIHWGEEYQDEPNALQREMARRLCELGADVIIGGHPHVLQRYEVLEGADGHSTQVLYSTGNAISNQRKEYMSAEGYRGYTEDGVIFIFRFDKYSDGSVRAGDVQAIPTWVEQTDIFRVVPLDPGKSPEEWPARNKALALESYQRTMGRLWG